MNEFFTHSQVKTAIFPADRLGSLESWLGENFGSGLDQADEAQVERDWMDKEAICERADPKSLIRPAS